MYFPSPVSESSRDARTSTGRALRSAALRLVIALAILQFFAPLGSRSHAQELRAEKIYAWSFRQADDPNSDTWPDGWQRRQDRRHPAYISMRIVPRDVTVSRKVGAARQTLMKMMHIWQTGRWDPYYVPESTPKSLAAFLDRTVLDNCIEIEMDGGAAEMISPKFELDPRFSYRLQADATCEGLDGHLAWVELQLLDEDDKVIHRITSDPQQGTIPWTRSETGNELPPAGNLHWGRIHLIVEPKKSLQINGKVRFDNIAIYRMPRLALSTQLPFNVAEPGQEFQVDCTAMGIKSNVSSVKFEIHDVHNQLIAEQMVTLEGREGSHKATQRFVSTEDEIPSYYVSKSLGDAYDGSAIWSLSLEHPGLYRVTVDLGQDSRNAQRRALLLAVMEPPQEFDAGPFGWSIQSFGSHLRPAEVPELVIRFGAGWLKYPVWFDMVDTQHSDELIELTERLQAYNINCVGRLDDPPEAQRSSFGSASEELYAVTVFRDHKVWEPLLEPVLTRMGMRLTWFQLGRDDDLSFMGKEDVTEVMAGLRGRMQAYCQELKLTMNWDWLETSPPSAGVPWNTVHYRTEPPLASHELEAYLSEHEGGRTETWVNLSPLPASSYTLLDRVRDLTERMIEVRKANVEAAFLSDPFDPETGIFTPDLNANEMLIPWHHLVSHLGTSSYAGSINMPRGSTNHVFAVEEDGVMLIWNNQKVTEQLFLGKNVSAVDIWGKPVEVRTVKGVRGTDEQQIEVGEWPIIIRGVNVDIFRWRQQFEIEITNLASRLGATQKLPVSISNTFNQSVSGTVALHSSSLLNEMKSEMPLRMTGGRESKIEMPIILRGDASTGEHQLRFDFDIEADEEYHFSVYRNLTLGLGDIQILWDISRNSPTEVSIRLELVNNTDANVSFDCKVFPPGQPYRRFQILDAAPGITSKDITLTVPGPMQTTEHWIRCEGIGSGRVLNYRVEF